jgi:hypothetical protein
VSVDGVMRTLEQRGYIAEIGKDPGPGQAVLFGTTPLFLEKLGLDNIDELPPLGDFVPGADVVEQLEQGLRPDRMPLRPEDAMLAGGAPVSVGDDVGDDDDADATGDDGFDRGGFGVESGFDLLAGMGEIAGISLDDDGGAPGAGSTNGHGHLPSDDGAPDVEAPDGIDLRDVRPTGRGDDDRPVDDE